MLYVNKDGDYIMHRKSNKKVLINRIDKQTPFVECKICGRKFKSQSGLAGHVVAIHCMDFQEYLFKYLKNATPDFKYEKCGFCDRMAEPDIYVDFSKNEYLLSYNNGYNCKTDDCINNVCLEFFGQLHSECKHKYEHLGANAKYLSKKYKIPLSEVGKKLKWGKKKDEKRASCSLEGYILRYGKKEGKRKYKERCKKISKSVTIEWYIERFGLEEGERRFKNRIEKTLAHVSNITHSKNQFKIFEALQKEDFNWKAERYSKGFAVDMMNLEKKIVIEYFGNYWHCNPKSYKDNYLNKSIGKTAKEIQEEDKLRIKKILTDDRISLVIVIWEKSFYDYGFEKIIDMIHEIERKYDINKKEEIWI